MRLAPSADSVARAFSLIAAGPSRVSRFRRTNNILTDSHECSIFVLTLE